MIMKTRVLALALIIVCVIACRAHALSIQEQITQSTKLEFTNGIMGNVDENFSPCRLDTKFEFYADGQNLYMICSVEIDSTFSKGNETKRDQPGSGDFIMMRLITVPNQNFAYTYVFYPLMNKEDYTIGLGVNQNYDWNSDYEYESVINQDRWVIYAKMPWKDMRTTKETPFTIGVIANRWMRNDGRGFNYPHVVRSMGEAYYSDSAQLTIPVRIARDYGINTRLYYTAKYDLLNSQSYNIKDYVGLDFTFRPQQNGSLKLTLQPDYSDVPLDSEDDIYNTLYKPWLQENRFFFKEDLDLLTGSNSYWYSRNIISPLAAVKYSLIQPNTSLIFLSAKDQKKQLYNGTDDFYNAFSIRQNIGKSQISVYAYNRMDNKAAYNNELASLMFSRQFLRNNNISVELSGSIARDSLSADYSSGTSGILKYSFSNMTHTFDLSGKYIDDSFRADMGNISLMNRNTFNATYTNYLNFPKSFISDFSNSVIAQYVTNHNSNERIEAYVAYRNQSKILSTRAYFGIDASYGDETYNGISYEYKKAFFSLGSNYWSNISPFIRIGGARNLVYRLEKLVDYAYVYGSLEALINPNATVKFDATYYRYDHPETENWDNEYLFANLDYAVNFNTGFRFNMGLRFNNIEVPVALYDGYFGYYFNSEWQISKILRINLGFQSKADHYSYSVDPNPTVYHLYDVTSQSIYLKTSVSF